jgi:hypothetical protein
MVQKCNMPPKMTPPLSDKQCTTTQKSNGSVLYYSRAVDPMVIMTLNDIATKPTRATDKTKTAAVQLLDYLATHPDAQICFHASDMILHIHSDASYLSVSKARSRLEGLFYLGYNPPKEDTLTGYILNVASIIVKLLPLPQPPLRVHTDARTNPSAQRATQLRSVLALVYAVTRQNQITTTVQ